MAAMKHPVPGSNGKPARSAAAPAQTEPAEVIVVGSGAAGGWAAKTFSEAGLRVLVLEAGPELPADDGAHPLRMAKRISKVLSGRQRTQGFHPGYWGSDPDLWVDDIDYPVKYPPDAPFYWMRGNQVGGRTVLWGGVALRLSDYELQGATREGFGFDWPVTYEELAPAYDRIEVALRVHGTAEKLPQLPDGRFVHAHPLTASEQRLREALERAWPDRRLIPCRGIDGNEPPDPGQKFNRLSSCGSTLADALRTGKTTLRPNSLVTHILPADGGARASGVAYIDTETGARREAHARLVVLCASAISSVLILLRTAAESSNGPLADLPALGHYIMDHVCAASMVSLPDMPYEAPAPRTGADSFLVPRFQNLDARAQDYRGGFGLWGTLQREGFHSFPGMRSALGFVVAHGDMEPRFENRVELAGDRDIWGLQVPYIDCRFSENDLAMRKAMRQSLEEVLGQAGGKARTMLGALNFPGPWRLVAQLEEGWKAPPPGSYAHEVGGARMGKDSKTSVVDPRNRCWGMPNVLVTDGACWPTAGWQNPALTIMAVTVRACELAVGSMKAGEL